MKKTGLLSLLLILLTAFLLRFLWLDRTPNGIGGDELVYVITAKAMSINWSDITGVWNPLSIFLFQYPQGELQAEFNYFLLYPFVFFGLSLFNARLPFVILGILNVLLIFLVGKKLFSEKAGLFAAFLAAINPWFVYIDRTAYEMTSPTFFFLLSFYIMLFLKKWKILIAIPFLFAFFYSYIAVKLAFVPLVLAIVIFFYYLNNKQFLKQYLILFFACFALVIFFAISTNFNTSGTRVGEILLPNNPEITNEVNELRKNSLNSPLVSVYENKGTVFSRIILTKFLNIFSFNYLFLRSDQFVSFINHGLFYFLDLIFIVFGLIFMYKKKRKAFLFLVAVILIGTLPHLFHKATNENFTPHITLIFAPLILIAGYGVSHLTSLYKKGSLLLIIVMVLYLILALNFSRMYFLQFPIKGGFDAPIRLLSKYISLSNQQGHEVVVYTNKSADYFKKYLFYSNSYDKKTFNTVKNAFLKREYRIGNVWFKDCDQTVDTEMTNAIIINDSLCLRMKNESKHSSIPQLIDGGERFSIYNDKTCQDSKNRRYPRPTLLKDLAIEKMSREDFCSKYITN